MMTFKEFVAIREGLLSVKPPVGGLWISTSSFVSRTTSPLSILYAFASSG